MICCLIWNQQIHCRFHGALLLDPIWSKIWHFLILPFCSFRIHFNIILPPVSSIAECVLWDFRLEEVVNLVLWSLQVFWLKFLSACPGNIWPNDSQGACWTVWGLSICQKRTAFYAVLCMDVASEGFSGTASLLFALSALRPVFLAHSCL